MIDIKARIMFYFHQGKLNTNERSVSGRMFVTLYYQWFGAWFGNAFNIICDPRLRRNLAIFIKYSSLMPHKRLKTVSSYSYFHCSYHNDGLPKLTVHRNLTQASEMKIQGNC